jgi:DNA-binding NarL/FixJ family response regulator
MAGHGTARQAVSTVSSVLIVDDHAAVRAGLAALLAPESDLEVIGTAADAEAAVTLCEQHAPDVVLIDFHLPGDDGLSLCLRLEGVTPQPRRVVYSAFADDLLAVLAAIAGADALVPKSADPEQLLAVARGRPCGTPSSPAALRTVSAALEASDLPVLGMLIHGTPPDEVADTLAMSPDWLLARRWAILRRLTPRRGRRGVLAVDAAAGRA